MALVTVGSYRDAVDAELARAQLESVGIPASLLDAQIVGIHWLLSTAIGGVKLEVDEADLVRAREVLREDHSADLAEIDESAGAPADGERCPVCGSAEVEPSRVHRIAAATSLLISVPIPVWWNRWVCGACGHSWKRHRDRGAEIPPVTLEAERAVYERRSYRELAPILAVLIVLIVLRYVEYRIGHPD